MFENLGPLAPIIVYYVKAPARAGQVGPWVELLYDPVALSALPGFATAVTSV